MKKHNRCARDILLLITFIMLLPGKLVSAHEWMAPKDAANTPNPISITSESVRQGKKLYLDNCAGCHGDNVQGMTGEEAGLEKSPPDLRKRLGNHTDGDFFWKIRHGRGEMPSFEDTLSDEEIWNIINFIKNK